MTVHTWQPLRLRSTALRHPCLLVLAFDAPLPVLAVESLCLTADSSEPEGSGSATLLFSMAGLFCLVRISRTYMNSYYEQDMLCSERLSAMRANRLGADLVIRITHFRLAV